MQAGPLLKEAETQAALQELADVAVANTRCDLVTPDAHFQLLLALNRQGWADEVDANLAVMGAYEAGKKAYDALPKAQQKAKCQAIATAYQAIDPTPRAPRVADGPDCLKLREQFIKATGAEFRRVSRSGENVFFEHKFFGEMSLSCTIPNSPADVFIDFDKGSTPPKTWFALAVKAGQVVTVETAVTLQAGIQKCYHAALGDPSELSSVELPKSKIECQAFRRDGGAVNMTIYADDGKDRD